MDFSKFTWIRTRDGSPTLWHNEEGASFRSQKGAFTESFHVFVMPALRYLKESKDNHHLPIQLIEFGLGLGTNWCLWTLASKALGLDVNYSAIERESQSFDMGYSHWHENPGLPANFIASELNIEIKTDQAQSWLEEARIKLNVISSLDKLILEIETKQHPTADVWFHDPFGFDVNPSAYQSEQLRKLCTLISPKGRAFTYACNSPFQKALMEAGLESTTHASGIHGLKRERLEFWPSPSKS